jgi:hypothetical protein
MGSQFATQGAYFGTKWKPLSEAYRAWKARAYPGRGIGHLTGRLMNSLTGGGGYTEKIDAKSAEFGQSENAEAAAYGHYFAKRRPLPLAHRRSRQKYEKATHRWIVDAERAAKLGTASGLAGALHAHGDHSLGSALRGVMR